MGSWYKGCRCAACVVKHDQEMADAKKAGEKLGLLLGENAPLVEQIERMREALVFYDTWAWDTDWDYWTSGNAGEDTPAHKAASMARKALESIGPGHRGES